MLFLPLLEAESTSQYLLHQGMHGLDVAAWALGRKKCWSWLLWLMCSCYFRKYIIIHLLFHKNNLLQWRKCLGSDSDLEEDFQSISHVPDEKANHFSDFPAATLQICVRSENCTTGEVKTALKHAEYCMIFHKCDLYSHCLSKSQGGDI